MRQKPDDLVGKLGSQSVTNLSVHESPEQSVLYRLLPVGV